MPSKTDKNLQRANNWESKGDEALKKKSYKTALNHFKKAKELNPENAAIYEKLIETHDLLSKEWSDLDFTESLSWTMKKQELLDPKFKRINAKCEPYWTPITKLIQQMISTEEEDLETRLVEKIVSHGKESLYPLIDALLSFKEIKKKLTSEPL